jgi:predicted O-methyltransferase YrrM
MSVALYIEHLKKAAEDANNKISKCTPDILALDGMSGPMTRHFYNNLLNTSDARYLEVGTWKGSSTCSAMIGNDADVTCIDNWSEFGGPKEDFLKNVEKFQGSNRLEVIEKDSFETDLSGHSKFNMYLYDGHHSAESHAKALTHFIDAMDDVFIYIVDDWLWGDTQLGTYRAIKELGLVVEYESNHSEPSGGHGWWNGTGVFVLRKP